ncbi:neurocan core protein-like [Branchiostoma floridae]|uniref:Neurocan core protein-like n=1 Tax=Branchiostoma floridae TaxID=7739 RepID=A0A9J7HT78_BRAFL|nr:neurocan core protein-like [Branchiostoma floridae]
METVRTKMADTCAPGKGGQNYIDECARKACLHGYCVNQDGGYRCNCRRGWTGKNCQDDIDECAINTCPHADCVNIAGGYGCTCFPGWTGQNCDQALQCQSGWHRYNIHCYMTSWITDEVSWSTASSRCQQHGAILASIKDHGENNFIADLISKKDDNKFRVIPSFWIGLHKQSEQWKWTDGSRLDYTNWAPDEPNGSLFSSFFHGEDCVSMYYKTGRNIIWKLKRHTGQWNDDRCNSNKPYICEKPI